jgi:DNA-binding FadR family transcriptional regulator
VTRPRAVRQAPPPGGGRFRASRLDASEQVALEIRRYLTARDLRPGERLGTEQELAAEFGVSRPTLREGLRLLASTHLVRASRGPGGGIFVASTPNEGMGRSLSESIATMLETDSVSLEELLDARVCLEVPLARRAAERATRETGRELQAAIDEAAGNHPASEAFRLADTRFHRVIAATARSELLSAFASWTLDVLQPSLVDTLGDAIDGEAILRQHRAIMRAVDRRRPAEAEEAMRRHLEYVRGLVRALGRREAREEEEP